MSSVAADLGRTTPAAAPSRDAALAPSASGAARPSRLRRCFPLLASVLATLGAAPLALILVQHTGELARYGLFGYPALFLVQALMSATLFLPAPGAAVAAGAGAVLDPVWVGVAGGLGSATGELSGYLLGYHGRRAVPVDRSRLWRLAERGFKRWGLVALFVLAMVPNPMFDALGILAGCMRYPVARFWVASAAGKVVKFLLLAYGGSLLGDWMRLAA